MLLDIVQVNSRSDCGIFTPFQSGRKMMTWCINVASVTVHMGQENVHDIILPEHNT